VAQSPLHFSKNGISDALLVVIAFVPDAVEKGVEALRLGRKSAARAAYRGVAGAHPAGSILPTGEI
jgi:hypothetical protein